MMNTLQLQPAPSTRRAGEPGFDQDTPYGASRMGRPFEFFLLLILITIPFWLFGAHRLPVPMKLPVSALAAFNPLIAAAILTYRQSGSRGLKELFGKAFDYKKIKQRAWYFPALMLNPLVAVGVYAILRLKGAALPDSHMPLFMIPLLFAVFFLFGIGEELGWMGYAFDPLQERWGALKASLVLGSFWALFHLIPDVQNSQPAEWILWHRLGTLLLRVLMVWIYNNTGRSVFSSILFHATDNLSWVAFPDYGSAYDPFLTTLLLAVITALVVFAWGPRTLAGRPVLQ